MVDPSTAPVPQKRLLFFSGGTALRATARFLAGVTPSTVHLITPFDSGGSSAALRRRFGMPAVGDIRNRLMALAAPTGNRALVSLFAHRLPKGADRAGLRRELDQLTDGTHPLAEAVPEPERGPVLEHLCLFRDRMGADFDLRGASVGNLMLAAGYLVCGRELAPAIDHFAELVRARGTVRPIVDRDLHLAVRLEDGRVVTGQHNITGKETEPMSSPIRDIWLTNAVDDPTPARATVTDEVKHLIREADLICFPMGSFYSSVVANLLPRGVGRSVAANPCPKIFVPSTGFDPEGPGLGVARRADLLGQFLEADGLPAGTRALDAVLVDAKNGQYQDGLDTASIRTMGLDVIDHPLTESENRARLNGQRLGEALLALA